MENEKLSFLDKLSKSFGAIAILGSVFVLFATLAIVVLAAGAGWLLVILLLIIGLITGILIAHSAFRSSGTMNLLSGVSASHELNDLRGIYSAAYTFVLERDGSREPYIAFRNTLYGGETAVSAKLLRKLRQVLKENGFQSDNSYQAAASDKGTVRLTADNTAVIIRTDNSDQVSIHAGNSPEAILNIQGVLQRSPHFKQLKNEIHAAGNA